MKMYEQKLLSFFDIYDNITLYEGRVFYGRQQMKIFIGSSSEAADKTNPDKNVLLKIAGILQDAGAEPIPWNTQPSIFSLGNTTIENLEELIKKQHIDAAVFIYSTDDKTWYRGEIKTVPRDNVVFEHGLFTGILGREKAITVKIGDVKMPSDLYGVTCIDYTENPYHAALNIMKWVKELSNNKCDTNNDNISKSDNLNVKIYDDMPKTENLDVKTNHKSIELIDIPQGTYYRIIDDSKIKINNLLSISTYLITQSIYYSIIGNNPSHFQGDSLPVENISFHEAIIFCNKLSVKEELQEVYIVANDKILYDENVVGYRLPYEMEWECALGYNRKEITDNLNELAWYSDNSEYKTHEVGQKSKNRFGIYDLLGNVWEWCFDSKDDGQLRVLRGGSFADFRAQFTTKGFRKEKNQNTKGKDVGIRVVLQNRVNN